ncbi:acetoacetate decarboxylase family protein [Algoriphagus confluentis]|uniref:Acetoacetate decarboxylase n=1 Tax=Algoriphagus confluentis TaxID=1697556 RepID=A0ABQ6PLP7_9BACT|nr:hypothetical protein Aconfl_08380 [Algoriphagus confluentis]
MDESQVNSSGFANSKKVPAPWELMGEGIILIYKFSKDWVEEKSRLPAHLQGQFKGGLGFVMLVDYQKSPVGPYRELLIIPGKFGQPKKQAITHIYVDSEASTQNGRANWGIPKNTVPFSWEKSKGSDQISIYSGKKKAFSATIDHGGIPFPVTTSLLPMDLRQLWEKHTFLTLPKGKGWGKLAKIKSLKLDPAFFPDIREIRPLLAVKVNPFHIHFPQPTILDESV